MTPKELVALVLAERQDEFGLHDQTDEQLNKSFAYAERFGENIRVKMLEVKRKKNRDKIASMLSKTVKMEAI